MKDLHGVYAAKSNLSEMTEPLHFLHVLKKVLFKIGLI